MVRYKTGKMAAKLLAVTLVILFCGTAWSAPSSRRTGSPAGNSVHDRNLMLYIGSYTSEGSPEGITLYLFNPQTGVLTRQGGWAASNTSFLALHPNGKYLYAVNENGSTEGAPEGSVSSFTIDPKDGALTPINHNLSRGTYPCHLIVDRGGRHVLVANYGNGSLASLPILKNGGLGDPVCVIQHSGRSVNPQRQEGPHAHSIYLDASEKYAVSADLGIDQVLVYRYNAGSGKLTPNEFTALQTEPGSGPRHLAFHPKSPWVYIINEMLSTVIAARYDTKAGKLEWFQTISTLEGALTSASSTAEIVVHPNGHFLYASNRGDDSIAVFAINPVSGHLAFVQRQPSGGKSPRNFTIDPTGKFLIAANQDSNNVVVFRIDNATGMLSSTGIEMKVSKPVCLLFRNTR